MKNISFYALFIIALAAFGLINGCDNQTTRKLAIENSNSIEPQNFGNGVYYFNCYAETFGASISKFIEREHKYLKIIAVAPNGLSEEGTTLGYWVICEEK
ncbi:MAG: hypothetical protein QMD65_00065 [Patescibacteria group bacterium]|nr:hypothetical protein [Patescibacteria group bacterium]